MRFFIFSCFFGLMIIFQKSCFASIEISSVLPAPEFGLPEEVHLINNSLNRIDLNGWQLWDTISSPSLIHAFENLVLGPNESFITFLNSSKLNNSGDTIVLKDFAGNNISDFSYTNAESGVLIQNNSFSSPAPNQFSSPHPSTLPEPSPSSTPWPTGSALPSPSPTSAASPTLVPPTTPAPSPTPASPPPTTKPTPAPANTFTPSPSPTPVANSSGVVTDGVYFIEILSCPVSNQEEWVIVENSGIMHQTGTIYLIDSANHRQSFLISLLPKEQQKLVLSPSILNNSGDKLYLENSAGTTLDSAIIPPCQTSSSFYKNSDGTWTQSTLQPNQANQIIDEDFSTIQMSQKSLTQPSSPQSTLPAADLLIDSSAESKSNKFKFWDYKLPNLNFTKNLPLLEGTIVESTYATAPIFLSGIMGSLCLALGGIYKIQQNKHAKDDHSNQRSISTDSLGDNDIFTLKPAHATRSNG